ncbi:hypothetical protein HZH66_005426 [Vespula vulgaris]|uniref:Uncharacterized protein n=1 Tax=Vespula vulgaris TaxID=7454 RepID=A0A834NCK3_VESVU|nr:hypothetical protein HZH66_005426 [Vespula vulgaris]
MSVMSERRRVKDEEVEKEEGGGGGEGKKRRGERTDLWKKRETSSVGKAKVRNEKTRETAVRANIRKCDKYEKLQPCKKL